MKTKACNPIEFMANKKISPIIEVYYEINNLKQLYRQGWLQVCKDMPEEKCESVADHIFGTALLAYFIADQFYPELDLKKVISMVLIHELGEIYCGDITPQDNICDDDKHNLEEAAIKRIVGKLKNGDKYLELWNEFEKCETPEASFVKQIDKLEAVMQASVYQCQGFNVLETFLNSTRRNKRIKLDELNKIMDELERLKR